jgi:predicted kinase
LVEKAFGEVNDYLDYADHLLDARRPMLIVTHGLSGSGKTFGTEPLLRIPGVIRIRSDIERKRCHGIAAHQSSESSVRGGIYSERESQATYQRLVQLARTTLDAGYSVILDAACLHKSQRELFVRLADELKVEYWLLPFASDVATMRERVQSRANLGRDASEATVAVLERQLEEYVPLTESEHDRCTTVDWLKDRLNNFSMMDRN